VATNLDATVPSDRGPLPGNGSLVAALRHATGVDPVATGKPDPTMHLESVQRSGARRPIVVGDRLDTDVQGANAADCPSLLVFTGVTGAAELLMAGPQLRPTYLAPDAGGLLSAHQAPTLADGVARCGAWTAQVGPHDSAVLANDGATDAASSADGLDPLRALCRLSWGLADTTAGRSGLGPVRGADPVAESALCEFGLGD
jgi:hypothetical protein